MKIMVSTILAAYMPTAGAIVIHATAAADPPNPELPETFSCEFNLTQLMDPSGPSGMTFDNHATGSTQQDAAGKGRSRLSMSMTTITTLPAAVFVTTTNNITDYEAGESWVQIVIGTVVLPHPLAGHSVSQYRLREGVSKITVLECPRCRPAAIRPGRIALGRVALNYPLLSAIACTRKSRASLRLTRTRAAGATLATRLLAESCAPSGSTTAGG